MNDDFDILRWAAEDGSVRRSVIVEA
jgi:hypothetical protein